MAKKGEITVKDVSIRTMKVNGTDYLCITDIAKQRNAAEPKDVVKNWMRQKNTLEYLGLWERLHNPQFNGVEFDPLLAVAGSNSFTMSPSRWVELTSAIGITSTTGRNGGTYAIKQNLVPAEVTKAQASNIRDYATINELICLSNMENINAVLINDGVPQGERLVKLNQIAIQQMKVLNDDSNRSLFGGSDDGPVSGSTTVNIEQ